MDQDLAAPLYSRLLGPGIPLLASLAGRWVDGLFRPTPTGLLASTEGSVARTRPDDVGRRAASWGGVFPRAGRGRARSVRSWAMLAFVAVTLLAAPTASRAVRAGGVLAQALTEGDDHYAHRADGASGGVARPDQVEAALTDYSRAFNLAPGSYAVRLRLLRAMFFRGGFCQMPPAEQIALFEEAKRLASDTVRRLEASINLPRARARREVLKLEPLAAEVYLWAAISWGQWAVDHKLAAARQGAAGQIRDLSQAVIDIAPETMEGAGYLILGRLHAEAPRIPLLTHWISREKALACLHQAYAVAPQNSANAYFLADALLRLQPTSRAEAVSLLRRCLTAAPRPEFLVEDTHYAAEARERLAGLHLARD